MQRNEDEIRVGSLVLGNRYRRARCKTVFNLFRLPRSQTLSFRYSPPPTAPICIAFVSGAIALRLGELLVFPTLLVSRTSLPFPFELHALRITINPFHELHALRIKINHPPQNSGWERRNYLENYIGIDFRWIGFSITRR